MSFAFACMGRAIGVDRFSRVQLERELGPEVSQSGCRRACGVRWMGRETL